MTTTRMRRPMFLALPTALAVAALAGSPAIAATPASGSFQPAAANAAPAPATQGIIMRDGGICDPIRHIGC